MEEADRILALRLQAAYERIHQDNQRQRLDPQYDHPYDHHHSDQQQHSDHQHHPDQTTKIPPWNSLQDLLAEDRRPEDFLCFVGALVHFYLRQKPAEHVEATPPREPPQNTLGALPYPYPYPFTEQREPMSVRYRLAALLAEQCRVGVAVVGWLANWLVIWLAGGLR